MKFVAKFSSFFSGNKTSDQRPGVCTRTLVCFLILQQIFMLFLLVSSQHQKCLKNKFCPVFQTVQHPNAGQNIQQASFLSCLQKIDFFHYARANIINGTLFQQTCFIGSMIRRENCFFALNYSGDLNTGLLGMCLVLEMMSDYWTILCC